MACTRCGQKTNSGMQMNNFATAQRQMSTLSNNDFELREYVGETGLIESVVHGINYGHKKSGIVMYVHISDIEANSELWQVIDD